jgi:hypothetical protein
MLIRRAGESWKEPTVTSYSDEQKLQDLIAEAPHLLPGSTGPLAVVRELPVSSGFVDILGVDPVGQVVICECKLDANADSRRKVVGQLLAYAGAIWELDFEALESRFSDRAGQPFLEAVREISGDDWDEQGFREGLSECLKEGSFRLIVAVDSITDELRQTLRFLNQHSIQAVEVMALEIEYTRDGELEIIVPQVYGEELTEPARGRKTWDEAGLLKGLKAGCTSIGFQAISALWDVFKERGFRITYGGGLNPSASIYISVDGIELPVFSIYAYENPEWWSSLSVNFEYMNDQDATRDRLSGLLERVRSLPNVRPDRLADVESSGFRKRPGLPIDDVVSADGAMDELRKIIDWLQAPA